MAAIRKKLIYAIIQEAFSEANKNPNLNFDLTNQQKLLDEIIFANKSLTKNEKAETVRIITESYDYFRIIKNEGERRICENCQYECLATFYCEICIRNYLKAYFSNWTSGNDDIDNLIQNFQMETFAPTRIIEWIPYNNFRNIKYLTEDTSEIYTAKWTDGPYDKWDSKKQQLKRFGMLRVILKKLENDEDANISWLEKANNKFSGVVKCFGLTINPEGYYMLVLQQMDINLKEYIQQNHNKITWKERIDIICDIIKSLYEIHKEKAIHRNLHSRHILYLQSANLWCISGLGFCGPADKSPEYIYGNLPYMAPELINGKAYNFASDIYSIGMLMWEISSGKPPFEDYDHDYGLAMKITNGIRPKMIPEIPLEYKQLIEQCWCADPSKRPDIDYLHNKIFEIRNLYCQNGYDELTFYKYNINLYQFFQSNKSIKLKIKINDYILDLDNHSRENGNEKIDDFIREIQSDIDDFNDIVFEWIPYNQFDEIKEMGKNGSITIYSAIWKDGPLEYDADKKIYTNGDPNRVIALKCLHDSQNITDKFLNEVKEYSINKRSNILNVYGISQNPHTKDYIMVLDYAKDGNFIKWTNENYEYFNWQDKLSALLNIINGLKEIHQKNIVHRNFHTGNILFLNSKDDFSNCISISDMGLCGEVGNIDETKILGVIPYVAPEVLRGKSYTKAADIYSFGMIMYFVATGRQPFYNRAHDNLLALDICNGNSPEINEPEAPRCYIDLMKKCWDLNPKNRPHINEVDEVITSLHKSSGVDIFIVKNEEIEMQFKEAEEYRKANLSSIKNYQADTHTQAIYTSRLLNPFTKNLSQSYNEDYESDLLDYAI
ncbi:kinase-like domain-containing protein [Rhizophagus irregularis DAOM 181602=DAOM 197198]|uniref:Kinase-like domain-containing protein n=1 Tax=Rhizophagus irregularis (strain DAOM 181602 / DAOM 197198 / MUCL 43194) TaxID=747089 RepID=A0A2P4QYM6_RHIID|nr:kinase-like domain-containing protein [Rhizophagus irregularis DAOM 181602=DAOM 197198]POG82761.1 kinase-like domain-containing protein [Rhizophagus irregularis DAOM 181602=DAOM 197198]|eukprot:XP_025189627.1 kinase-like domain-containing protein [Rhizophagus irregularis DAOM 181602=DAOM 197198]